MSYQNKNSPAHPNYRKLVFDDDGKLLSCHKIIDSVGKNEIFF